MELRKNKWMSWVGVMNSFSLLRFSSPSITFLLTLSCYCSRSLFWFVCVRLSLLFVVQQSRGQGNNPNIVLWEEKYTHCPKRGWSPFLHTLKKTNERLAASSWMLLLLLLLLGVSAPWYIKMFPAHVVYTLMLDCIGATNQPQQKELRNSERNMNAWSTTATLFPHFIPSSTDNSLSYFLCTPRKNKVKEMHSQY